MELNELNADERIALAGLLKTAILANGKVSDGEVAEVQDIVDGLGEPQYQQALDAFESRFSDLESFKKFLRKIDRQDARDLIYGTVLEGATEDAIGLQESELLSWLAEEWKIDESIADDN